MKTLFTAAQITEAVQRTASEVLAHFGAKDEVLVPVLLDGALWFAADLLRYLPPNFIICPLRVSSYGAERSSSGQLTWKSPVPEVAGRRVLVVDDVLDTGLTLHKVCEALCAAGAAEVRTAVAVDKAAGRSIDFKADFCALRTEKNLFLVGYGMDDAGRFRNLPDIMVVNED